VGATDVNGDVLVLRNADRGSGAWASTIVDTDSPSFFDVVFDNGALYVAAETQPISLFRSSDFGVSFASHPMASVQSDYTDFAAGGGWLFLAGEGDALHRVDLLDSSTVSITGLGTVPSYQRAIAADEDGRAYVIESTGEMDLRLHSLAAGETTFTTANVGMGWDASVTTVPGGAALSFDDGGVFVTIQMDPVVE
jgi:hypothetical protein